MNRGLETSHEDPPGGNIFTQAPTRVPFAG